MGTSIPLYTPGAARLGQLDLQGDFQALRDTLSKVKLPAEVRLNDCRKGIKQADQPLMNVLSKCGTELNQKMLDDFLQEEFAALLVGEQFDSTAAMLWALQRTVTRTDEAFPDPGVDVTVMDSVVLSTAGRRTCFSPLRIDSSRDDGQGKIATRRTNPLISGTNVQYVLNRYRGKLLRTRGWIASGDWNLMAYVNSKGGPSSSLSKIAISIWAEAIEIGVSIRCAHIAGKTRQTQLDASSTTFCVYRPSMGSAHHRQICELSQCAGSALQQQVLGTDVISYVIQNQRTQATVIAPKWLAQPWYTPPLKLPNNPRRNLAVTDNGHSSGEFLEIPPRAERLVD
ncbi:hypothetical protein DPMN_023627 [Dreissena polymorpha]|uniref:Uncharacterized protein n=1 Tax=Dreissena polymorpha TaxID=45954 RepID=A0A9D4LN23_DREPO|nr:hypothetical protein DPMN_023627 [Dreissena polymorpha]